MTEKPSPRCPRGWPAIVLPAIGLDVMMQAGAALAQTPQDILLYTGPDREQKLLEGARKEGQVVIYAALIQNQAMRPIAEGFGRKYPFVKLTTWRADSE